MLWIINGLIYGFFTAVYILFNQHFKLNGYVLGIWRGFGISILFLPALFFFPLPRDINYWLLLITQGICIDIYDSHIFFASAKFGAGPTSRFMMITVLLTTFMWWFLTPQKFIILFRQGNTLITLLLILCGFCYSYWQMLQSEVSQSAALYTLPAVISLSLMSIITKYISLQYSSPWQGLSYYLTVSVFISGVYNLIMYRITAFHSISFSDIVSYKMLKIGGCLVAFSTVLIIAKTMSLRLAPNPGYVTALLLIAPIFIFVL
ncbi:MAG: hypothetical protein ILA52_00140, partial [Alphaproteobacteria bacterium]|nr:hypothetical protein [Alphaproteobacteria bacterium]